MQGFALILFALFALVLVGLYLAIRREWANPGMVAGGGMVLSIFLMILTSLAQGNVPLQAIVVGIVIGAVFSGATLAVAWYFHSQERRAAYTEGEYYEEG
ncbi:MAG: hypothetical protein H6672_07525 [Anaerolineaceae bacterium]|nr:hypothetical protein [Anaerolineaceae bacterium]